MDLEEASISSLKALDPDALRIANSGKIEVLGRAALVLNEGADLELIDSVVVLVGAGPGCV